MPDTFQPLALLTEDELRRAVELFSAAEPGTFARRCVAEILTPEVMERVQRDTGKELVPMFYAYTIEHVLTI